MKVIISLEEETRKYNFSDNARLFDIVGVFAWDLFPGEKVERITTSHSLCEEGGLDIDVHIHFRSGAMIPINVKMIK